MNSIKDMQEDVIDVMDAFDESSPDSASDTLPIDEPPLDALPIDTADGCDALQEGTFADDSEALLEEDDVVQVQTSPGHQIPKGGWQIPPQKPVWTMVPQAKGFGERVKTTGHFSKEAPVLKRENGAAFGKRLDLRPPISDKSPYARTGPQVQTHQERLQSKMHRCSVDLYQSLAKSRQGDDVPAFSNLKALVKTKHYF